MLQLGSELFDLLNAHQWVGNQQPILYGKVGLSAPEIKIIQNELGFQIPEDFVFLLQNIQDPGGVLFPWSNFSKKRYDESITWVFEGIEFDIEKNNFWLEERWGPRPETLLSQLDIARRDFGKWPKLLPVYGHRFLAAEPDLPDNPVFSIKQTDIIYYGANLAHYLIQEFIRNESYATHTYDQKIRQIDVWSGLAS